MAALLYWLRGAFNRFVDDGGLYSSYNGERPYEAARSIARVKHVTNGAKPSGKLTFHKA